MADKKGVYYSRIVSQIIFLTVFFGLIWTGFTQVWLVIFGVGVIGSLFFGRFYCGWVCPINTLSRPIKWVYKKSGKNRLKTPSILRKNVWRWVALIAFISGIVYVKTTGLRLPVFLIVVLIGAGFFLVFGEETFHKYLCPYGAILSVASKFARYGLIVDKSECIGCGKCQEVCPNNTIITLDSDVRYIEDRECLNCFRCEESCPVDVIKYGKT
ncbi:hypothetical protein AKJ62_02480 [candidate division MSBL1 archaeon SCGC-AAA259D14]|uniref:4Fe-4S ferredoxin-type domain-containing protein n=2 Tax=candidate division MSBL1 TaxID=215777 RepID=A0A133U685_9EURY|nr:hypothetical protein AKJ62_02480 [candidate division MSBL1 archaeon SCGC-AAA259D14]KXA93802.1 hypothetical protein AKJ66_00825 [candidate division MSBL1 archaeon SCGC-AAA259E22]